MSDEQDADISESATRVARQHIRRAISQLRSAQRDLGRIRLNPASLGNAAHERILLMQKQIAQLLDEAQAELSQRAVGNGKNGTRVTENAHVLDNLRLPSKYLIKNGLIKKYE